MVKYNIHITIKKTKMTLMTNKTTDLKEKILSFYLFFMLRKYSDVNINTSTYLQYKNIVTQNPLLLKINSESENYIKTKKIIHNLAMIMFCK